MENLDTITVVIPTFNRVEQLTKAVESVLSEHRVPIVVRIFDNASTDATEEYVRRLVDSDPRVMYERRDQNIGSISNFQRALGAVSTAYFVPLADDDLLLPDFLHDAYQVLQSHPAVGAAIFVGEERDETGALLRTYPRGPLDEVHFGERQTRDHLRDWMMRSHYLWTSILWRREVLEHVGAPYMRTGLSSDVDFQARIFSHFPVYLVDQRAAVYFRHSGQSSLEFDASHLPSWARVFRSLDRAVAKEGLFGKKEYRALRATMTVHYKGTWLGPLPTPFPLRRRLSASYSAGFVLRDWDSAARFIGIHISTVATAEAVQSGVEAAKNSGKKLLRPIVGPIVRRLRDRL